MKVKALIEFLLRQNPDATVVISDRAEFFRAGRIRPLRLSELRGEFQLGEVAEDDGTWLCEWSERPGSCEGPMSGLLLGPR